MVTQKINSIQLEIVTNQCQEQEDQIIKVTLLYVRGYTRVLNGIARHQDTVLYIGCNGKILDLSHVKGPVTQYPAYTSNHNTKEIGPLHALF